MLPCTKTLRRMIEITILKGKIYNLSDQYIKPSFSVVRVCQVHEVPRLTITFDLKILIVFQT